MANFLAHSDWTFEHSTIHDLHDSHSLPAPQPIENGATASSSSATAGLLQALWHQCDTPSGGGSNGLATSQLALLHPTVQGTSGAPSAQAPSLTIASNALTVTGSAALPTISVSPVNQGDPLLVTITGLTSYETLTDGLDTHVFSGDTVTLTSAEVASGLTLTSTYTGSDHPVNTLSVTASELIDHHYVTSAAQTITVTDPPASGGTTISGTSTLSGSTVTGTTGTGSSGNPLTLQVSGDNLNGTDAQFQVLVDGQQVGGTYTVTADHASGQTQTITINGNFDPLAAHQVQIQFVNDSWDGTSWWANGGSADGHDVNLYVDSISLNGATLTGVQGTNGATSGVAVPTNGHEVAMTSDGTLSFNVPADPPAISGSSGGTGGTPTVNSGGTSTGSSGNPLMLQVSGDNLNGTDAQFQVLVDGQQVGGTYTVTADHASGQTQTITVNGNFDPLAAHQVQIQFMNDGWDGTSWWSNGGSADGHDVNLYVDSISLNGMTLTGIQGTNGATSGVAVPTNGHEVAMTSDGTLSFNVPADPPASPGTIVGGTVTGGTVNTVSGGSGTSGGGVGTGAGAPPSGPGFFVSPNGNDSNPGTLDAPFATLQRAQQAMENSSIKTTYIEAGTYNITSTINITAADNGETWTYYPPSGVNSAVLDGGNTVDLFSINGASNVTIDGIKMQHVYDSAVSAGGALSNNIVIENCDIGFNQATSLAGGFNPIIGLGNVTNAHVLNNYVHDTASQGIALYAFNAGETCDGGVISGNVVLRAVQQVNDGGAIYLDMRYSNVNGGHVTISNNFIKDYGAAGVQAEGIYLDDDSSNVTVSGNVIGPMNPAAAGTASKATIVNGGCNNVFSDNIVDLGTTATEFVTTFQTPGGGGAVFFNWTGANVWENNIIVSNYAGGTNTGNPWGLGNNEEYAQGFNYPTQFGVIQNNLYYNYGGGSIDTHGNLISDTNATVADPQISGSTYTIASGSPALSTISFAPIIGGWGPQGFVIT